MTSVSDNFRVGEDPLARQQSWCERMDVIYYGVLDKSHYSENPLQGCHRSGKSGKSQLKIVGLKSQEKAGKTPAKLVKFSILT